MTESARVLFVEDDAGLAGIVVRHLRARGHDARVAGSAEDAIEMVAAGFLPSVVLLDINLPGASGWDLLRSGGLGLDPAAPAIYIVSATNVPPARLREFGVAGFLPKPFALPTLIEVVERDRREASDAAQTAAPGGFDAI
jgi:two-component system, OmpR family, KDP operon response regulator KdpE